VATRFPEQDEIILYQKPAGGTLYAPSGTVTIWEAIVLADTSDPTTFPGVTDPGLDHNGNGYQVTALHDPGGPFNGKAYVKSASLKIARIGIFNPDILEGALPSPHGHSKIIM